MKKGLLILLISIGCLTVSAQQEPLITQYMFNKVYLNPAAAGTSGAICASGMGRYQWIGMEDMQGNSIYPRTYGLAFDMPVYRINSGVGVIVQYDELGHEKNLNLKFIYSYHHVFSNNTMLSLGLDLGIYRKSIDFSELYGWGDDPLIQSTSVENGSITDVGFGIHYQKPRKYYFGLSATNLLGSSAEIGAPEFTLTRHFYFFGGYHLNIIEERDRKLVITPGLQARATPASLKVDINAIATYNDFIWGGLMYRIASAAGIMAGVKYYGFNLGVCYEFNHDAIAREGNKSSVEVFLKYCYPIYPKEPRRSGYNTRNL